MRTYVLFTMRYPPYLKERARELRTLHRLSLDEIAERLALPKTTVWYWIRDLPLDRERRASLGRTKGNRAMQAMYRRRREEAYRHGREEFDALVRLPTFRDFVVLYVAEGYKRDRNVVSISNSDPKIVAMAASWMRYFSDRGPVVRVQYHADQDPTELIVFWSKTVDVDPSAVRLHPKSNSGQLTGRRWRCVHGVAAIDVDDTAFRARLEGWIDHLKEGWGLDSAA